MNKHPKLTEADVTPESVFHQRRKVLQALGITAATLALPTGARADLLSWFKGNDRPKAPPGKALEFSKPAAAGAAGNDAGRQGHRLQQLL